MEKVAIRTLVLGGALAAAVLLPSAAAHAYEGPWCLRASVARGTVSEICHFRTFEACAQERFNYGTTSFCGQNSRYLPYWQGRGFGPEAAPPHRKKKKYRRNAHR
jgi:hypothetical protein